MKKEKEAIIDIADVYNFGCKIGYDMEIFTNYLINSIGKTDFKWTMEKYAIANPSEDIRSYKTRDFFSRWMNLGTESHIPETHSYLDYARNRDLWGYTIRKFELENTEECIKLYSDDEKESLKISKKEDSYEIEMNCKYYIRQLSFGEVYSKLVLMGLNLCKTSNVFDDLIDLVPSDSYFGTEEGYIHIDKTKDYISFVGHKEVEEKVEDKDIKKISFSIYKDDLDYKVLDDLYKNICKVAKK